MKPLNLPRPQAMTVLPFPRPRRNQGDGSSSASSAVRSSAAPVDRSVLLVVDGDSMMQERVAQGFTLYDRRFEVLDARDPDMALAAISASTPPAAAPARLAGAAMSRIWNR